MYRMLLLICICTICTAPVFGAWPTDAGTDIVVMDNTGDTWGHEAVHDGKGGYFVCWYGDGATSDDIFIQYYDKNGDTVWASTVVVCDEVQNQTQVKIIRDDSGGVIVVWGDYRSGSAYGYAQRIDKDGNALWTANGVLVIQMTSEACYRIVTDGSGGALIFSQDSYMNRIDKDGALVWTAADACDQFSTTSGNSYVKALPDGAGGAFLTFEDSAGNWASQRVDKDGNLLWNSGADVVLSDTTSTNCHRMSSCGDGFAMIWVETGLRAVKVNSAGVPQWANPNGVSVTTDVNSSQTFGVTDDKKGGVFVTWASITDDKTYIQRLASADGSAVWAAPVALKGTGTTNTWNSGRMQGSIVSDGKGNAIAAWTDDSDVLMAQKVDTDGNLLWAADGVIVSNTVVNSNKYCSRLVSNGQGSAVMTFVDDRGAAGDYDLFMKAIASDGTLSTPVFKKKSSGGGGCGVMGGIDLAMVLSALGAAAYLSRRANKKSE